MAAWYLSTNGDTMDARFTVYDASDVGRAVRTLRTRRSWSQSDLADWLGVHRVTVSKLERGGTVDLPLVVRALAILGARMTIDLRSGGGLQDG